MTISLQRIQTVARQTRFDPAVVEKVIHLMSLLEAIDRHPILRGNFALKGGTALNLFNLSAGTPSISTSTPRRISAS